MSDRTSDPSPSPNLRTNCSSDVDALAHQLKYDIQPEQEIQPEEDTPQASGDLQDRRSRLMVRAEQQAGDGVGQASEEA